MGNLYIVRHSLSYFNEQQKYAGNQDIPLSKRGIIDSIELGKKFNYLYHDCNIDAVFTSTLSRSFDTAILLLSELNLQKTPIKISRRKFTNYNKLDMLPIVSFSELNERNYGILQNMDKHEVENLIHPEVLYNWRRNFYAGPVKGETFENVVSRVARFYFDILLPVLKEKDILLVAHQNTIRALYYLIYNVDKLAIKDIEFENSEIWTINYDDILNKEEIIRKNVIIMAAGKGTRMKDLTVNMPKPLLDLAGRELISYSIEYLHKESFNITITYSYLKEKWDNFKKKYPYINYCYTDSELLYWEDFLYAYSQTKKKSNYFIMLSGDMLFDYNIISKSMQQHIISKNLVTVVLNKKYGKWKKWQYVFAPNNVIKDIILEQNYQPYERYFVIFNKEIIEKFSNLSKGVTFCKSNEYGSGACFIIKNLIDMGIKVNCLFFDDFLVNINDANDLDSALQFIKGR